MRLTNLSVIGLILLLSIQLTGVSCLGEWHILPSSASSASLMTGAMGAGQIGDDGCPCHLAFVFMPGGVYSVESPASPADSDRPASCPSAALSVPFHPPLGS
jgi:hypothetical protein